VVPQHSQQPVTSLKTWAYVSRPVIVAVALNPSVDRLAVVSRVVPGSIHRPSEVVAVAGGKGLNAARVARALGADVLAVCLAGGHAGEWVLEELAREGVRTLAARCSNETRSSLSVFSRDDATLTEFYEPGPVVGQEEWESFRAHVGTAFRQASWASVSGSLPAGVPAADVAWIIEEAAKVGVPVAVDLRGEALRKSLAAGPNLVKVNENEARDAVGIGGGKQDIAELAAALSAELPGDGAVVVTGGTEGAVLCCREGTWRACAPAKGPFSVGSGDAFLGAMVAALDRGESLTEALMAGSGAGAANALVPGAGRLDPGVARDLARQVRLERLSG